MDTQRFKTVFAEALERTDLRERDAYLDAACAADAELRAEVHALLWAAESTDALQCDLTADLVVPPTEGPGSTVGHYRLVRQIGQGGVGVVFLAEQSTPVRRQVALKVVKLGMDTRQVIARFGTERQALAMMNHPNIARVYDAGATATGRPYFAMELVHGVPLTEFCDSNDLPIRGRLELFAQVCAAVQHAHQRGIIHRDLKPSNVLVTTHDDVPVPKVIDFGIAKATLAPLTEHTPHTEFHQFVGTPQYTSPEQAGVGGGGGGDVDTRADVYSLGALLYELLTGAPQVDRASMGDDVTYLDLLKTIREVDPPPPSVRRRRARPGQAAISPELDWIVMKCLEKDRERRYPSVTALAEDVGHFLNGEPVHAVPSTAGYRLRKFVSRHKTSVTAALLVTLAVVAAVVGTTIGLLRARAAQRQAEQNLDKARSESARASAVTTFLGDVFSLAESGVGLGGEDASARDLLQRAAGQIDAKLVDRPRDQVVARRLLAHGCERMFLYDLAADELRKASDAAEGPAAGLDEARCLDLRADWALAMYLAKRGVEAAPDADSTLRQCRRVLGDAHPVTWEAMQASALCASQVGDEEKTYELLKLVVEVARPHPASRRASRLGRYLCNWSAALRDHGEFDAAAGAIREAAPILLADVSPDAGPLAVTQAATAPDADPWTVAERAFDPVEGGGWIAREMVEAGVPEASPLIERYVERALARHPQGTPAISYRLEDVANLRLRHADLAGAAAAFARAIEVSPKPRGGDGGADSARWRMATLRCAPGLTSGWRSEALRAQVWCALDDLLRDHPPARLATDEMSVDAMTFKLLRWDFERDAAVPLAEGGLSELKAMGQPPPGTYLLGLDVPRLGADPLRRADWLFLQPWTTAVRPILRFDGVRTDNAPNDQDWAGVLGAKSWPTQGSFGLALQDGLFSPIGPSRIQWFVADAVARVDVPAGRYRLSATSDDGVRLSVDGQRVIDRWRPRPSGTSDAELQWAGGPHELHVELFQETGGYCLWLQLAPLTAAAKSAAAALGGGVPGAEWEAGWFGQLRRDSPRDPRYIRSHGLALAAAGRFRESADAYGAAVELTPTDRYVWFSRAMLLAWLADDEAYRRVARGLFDRFADSADAQAMSWVLISCGMRAELSVDEARYRGVLARADAATVDPPDRPFLTLARGLAHLRLSDPKAAARLFEECSSSFPPEHSARRAAAELYLAIANAGLGAAVPMKKAFSKGERIVDVECRHAGVEDVSPFGFENWLLSQTALREARALVHRAAAPGAALDHAASVKQDGSAKESFR